jgi:precorrin-6Y C5,15-methyltransferase (decarboxylating)
LSAPWLSVVGIGEDGLAGLAPPARALVDAAEVLAGGARHLAMVPDDGRERLAWPTPLDGLIDEILRRRGRRVCVLATGDPLCYGVGAKLARRVPIGEMTIVPAPSAFSLACARLGWSLPDIDTLTLHGRPVETMHPFVLPGARLLLLGRDGGTPAEVAALLAARGYGASRITVLEHMGGAAERRIEGTAAEWRHPRGADLATIAVECVAGTDAPLFPRSPGLPDEAYRHDGQLTKRELRAVTLAALMPVPGQLLWDVGAGAGSVAIEWMRADPRCRAVAIERDPARRTLIAANAAALGAPRLDIVAGEAPAALAGLPAPDAVFIGGGLGAPGLAESCWRALRPGGRLVANAVTVEGEAALAALRGAVGGELARISIARGEPVGRRTGWRALMPVTQFAARKR